VVGVHDEQPADQVDGRGIVGVRADHRAPEPSQAGTVGAQHRVRRGRQRRGHRPKDRGRALAHRVLLQVMPLRVGGPEEEDDQAHPVDGLGAVGQHVEGGPQPSEGLLPHRERERARRLPQHGAHLFRGRLVGQLLDGPAAEEQGVVVLDGGDAGADHRRGRGAPAGPGSQAFDVVDTEPAGVPPAGRRTGRGDEPAAAHVGIHGLRLDPQIAGRLGAVDSSASATTYLPR
jgi:hypothetical protein